jgi:hypothetical protein
MTDGSVKRNSFRLAVGNPTFVMSLPSKWGDTVTVSYAFTITNFCKNVSVKPSNDDAFLRSDEHFGTCPKWRNSNLYKEHYAIHTYPTLHPDSFDCNRLPYRYVIESITMVLPGTATTVVDKGVCLSYNVFVYVVFVYCRTYWKCHGCVQVERCYVSIRTLANIHPAIEVGSDPSACMGKVKSRACFDYR